MADISVVIADHIATVTLDRPPVNAVDTDTFREIRDTFQSPIPPADLDGLRRRTRVMNGRCQGFYCGAHAKALLTTGGATR